MSDSSSNSSPQIHHMFWKSVFLPGMNQELNFISSIWEDDHIEKLDNNHWECLWCDNTFQGINDTRYLTRVLWIRGMHIRCYVSAIDKNHLSRYKYLRHYKAAKKNVIRDQSQKANTSIPRLYDKTSEVIKNTIHRKSGTRYFSNLTASSE